MTTEAVSRLHAPVRLSPAQIERGLQSCPRLPSLSTINSALRELLNADQRYTSQVAEIIRRDPSLTARLLRLVNSVYYGLSAPVNSIEEAVFYLGVRQIRQLAMVTPIIEDFQKLAGRSTFAWREFWQHCIGTAILTREVKGSWQASNDETDYVAGLVHDVGKIAMASAFPAHFGIIYGHHDAPIPDMQAREREILGIDHSELGALYLKHHNLPDVLVETARYHHEPERAGQYAQIVSAVQIANMLIRHANIGSSGDPVAVSDQEWLGASGWGILYPHKQEAELAIAHAHLRRSLERLPTILEGLV
jgi:HD-like signal output (HDOD) protein